ncbi:MAG: hypothetical protein WAN60_16330 [Candidatus Sulfotelmatobacter sp.]
MNLLTTESQRHRENKTKVKDSVMTNVPVYPTLAEALEKLVGRALSSVTFVADYIQFAFDGSGLTAYTLPIVSSGSERLGWGQAGYRDLLCKQICCRVQRVEVNDQRVSVLFKEGTVISISLLDKDYTGPEALQFSLDQQRIWIV